MADEKNNYANLSVEMKNMMCFSAQTKWLAISYFCFVVLDFILMGIGNVLMERDHDFICENQTELLSINNAGAAFLLLYTLFMLSFSIMIWFIFYKLPDIYSLIHKPSK
jgi:hypothetical protein